MATSGTTGEPKLVMHSHRSTVGGVLQSVAAEMGLTDEDVMCMPSPLAHATGLQYGARLAPTIGATLLLVDAWDPEAAADLIAEHQASWFMGATPFLYDMIGLSSNKLDRVSSLRRFVCGGAPIPTSLAVEAERVFPDVSFMSAWGMSETGIVTLVRPGEPLGAFSRSDGSAVPGWDVRIVDPQTIVRSQPALRARSCVAALPCSVGITGARRLPPMRCGTDGCTPVISGAWTLREMCDALAGSRISSSAVA